MSKFLLSKPLTWFKNVQLSKNKKILLKKCSRRLNHWSLQKCRVINSVDLLTPVLVTAKCDAWMGLTDRLL